MAKENKTKKKENKIILERVYNVPLRQEFLKVPIFKRAKKAVKALKEFLEKHMKSDKVKIGKYANLKIWENSIKNPPHHIKVVAKKDEEGNVFAELEGAPVEKPVEPVKKKETKNEDKKATTVEEKDIKALEEKVEIAKEEKAEKSLDIEKEEIKELKKDHHKMHPDKEERVQKQVEIHQSAPSGRNEMSKP
jgi:large subunit ribosomal protein L31e